MCENNILMIHKHFFPDSPPYAYMLRDIAGELEKNATVTILSTQPHYKIYLQRQASKEKIFRKVQVRRLNVLSRKKRSRLRYIIDAICFPLKAFFFVLVGKENVITVSTAPPVFLGFFVAVACFLRKKKMIYHCMDIHPEIGKLSGDFSRRLMIKVLKKMDNFTLKVSSVIIVLSSDMKHALDQRGVNCTDKVRVINNFSLGSIGVDRSTNDVIKGQSEVVRLIFAGNLGRFQNLENVIHSFNQVAESVDIELFFVGDGKLNNKLQKLANTSKIKFFPQMNVDEVKKLMKQCDFGLVSLDRDLLKYAYPSKTITYLSAGLPLAIIADVESELAQMVRRYHLGVVSNGDVKSISDMFVELDKKRVGYNSGKVIDFYEEKFEKSKILKIWSDLVESLNE